MKKKRNQHDSDGSEDSSESGNRSNLNSGICAHFGKAVDYNNIQKFTSIRSKNPFPLRCSDCVKNNETSNENKEEFYDSPPLWICLKCVHTSCGRSEKQHAKKHCLDTPRSDLHCIVIDTIQWTTWCYKCDEYITDDMLSPANFKTWENIKNQLKKWASTSIVSSPSANEIPSFQNKILSMDSEKKKILADVPKVGGLANLGNTCFFNSVLQCLAQTPYIIKVLDDLQVPDQTFELPGGKCKGTDDEEIEVPVIRGVLERNDSNTITSVLRKTLAEMQSSNGHTYTPRDLLFTLRKKTIQCTDGGQHDSHELLRTLLEHVRNEDVRGYQEVILENFGLSRKTKPEAVEDNLKSRVKFYGNQANAKFFLGPERVFRGELISTIECQECTHISTRTEPFLDLSLPVCAEKFTVIKRKGSDNISDASNTLSKHQLSKLEKANKKRNKKNSQKNRKNGNLNNVNFIAEEKKDNNESEESDADIEDNVENEDLSNKIDESGLSSRPLSTAALNVSNNKLSLVNNRNSDYVLSPNEESPTDVQMKDLTEKKHNISDEFSVSTSSLIVQTPSSPEGQMLSPSSSPLLSKNSPTSNEENIEKENLEKNNFDPSEKQESSDKEDSFAKTSSNQSDENISVSKDNCTDNKLANGVKRVSSNLSKLKMSSPSESPIRSYPTKDGECSVQQCLNNFTALELMDGNNKVGCTKCTEKMYKGKKGKMVCTESTKQYLISKAPAVLILHLKRFQAERYRFNKVKTHVSFPTILNLAPVSKDYSKPRVYSLYGVVEHSGTLYGGHYIAYVKSRAPLKPNDPRWSFLPSKDGFKNKNSSSSSSSSEYSELDSDESSNVTVPPVESPPGRWYYASDSYVHEVEEEKVLNSEAYLLFYERIF